MSKFKKLIESLRQNPNHVRYEDVEKILIRLGFERQEVAAKWFSQRAMRY